ncbi:MAG: ATP-dependent DNA helicase RecG [Anaerolineae bacterium]|nr:ATP-dependent DNA helicase RecG [Anaerolineae bacterium]
MRLEETHGYRDRAVIGGFDTFVRVWQEEALGQGPEETQVRLIDEIVDLLAGYGNADHRRRVEVINDILSRLSSEIEPATGPRRPSPYKPGSPAAKAVEVQMPPPQKPGSAATPAAAPPPPPPEPAPAKERTSSGLDAPVTTLPGVSTAYSARLERLGIQTVRDMIYHFPHRYDDYSQLKPINRLEYGDETTVIGTIWETRTHKTRSGSAIVTSVIADASGTIEAVWFNQPYLTRQLRAGRRIVLSGKVDEYLGRLRLQSPSWEPLEKELIHTGRMVPVYPLTRGVSSRWMRRLIKRVLDHWVPLLDDYLPDPVREREQLLELPAAIQQIHFPESKQTRDEARRRLSFDEFFFIQLGMLQHRLSWQSQEAAPIELDSGLLSAFLESLSFELTDAQKRSLETILGDLSEPIPMSRLLQGDVGSGKTVVAAAAMLMAVAAGKQAALMAPTEILAEQHYRTVSELLANAEGLGLGRPVSVELLTGSLGRVDRRKVYTALASGEADIVVGTHALIQRHVAFDDLALVVVDEQHRFGVLQRGALRSKGGAPHMLVMSATPIPRSLALTVYGDLEISVIDELPPGREPIETRWLLPRERERAYSFLRSQIEKGRQAFILYPLIEESDKVEARAAVDEYERLQSKVFPELTLGLLHGRMKAKEKDSVMERFRAGEIDILISTSVIEVGIDVPNATVMLIEGADRFGLAQLHQFRGRVGRGAYRSYCLLLSDSVSPEDPKTRTTWERLRAIEETQDGFVLAEKDLELRGPGDFFGVRQSGLPALRLASLSNLQILEQARGEALKIFEEDPALTGAEHQPLAEQVERFWQGQGDLS